jgi:single-strand selective monofunctional uracil DNA glycosylase
MVPLDNLMHSLGKARVIAEQLKKIYRDLSLTLDGMAFGPPTAYVYNPLDYARSPAEQYLERFGGSRKEILLLGMNPGPWGMAQTGVPFGTVTLVRDWLGIVGPVGKPRHEHPRRPIQGFAMERDEVSGSRLWGWARERFGPPERFFERFFVANYCPLVFMEASGRNRTPDKLPAAESGELFRHCDQALRQLVSILAPSLVVGIGKFAEDRARSALTELGVRCERILHPSPASPAANRGWMRQAEEQLQALGIDLPTPRAQR